MRNFTLGLLAISWAIAASASDQADYSPAPSWVKPVEIPPPQDDSKTDIQVLLEDFQTNFTADGDDYYEEIAERIQTPQGLDKAGSVVLEWRPDIENLVIHKLHIIRDGQVIDVLANGQKFLILRRETNLELAMLDGTLTAAIQPEGLRLGDILDVAFTQQQHDPLFKGHSQLFMRNPGMMPIRHLSIRELWPKSKSLQWRQTEGLAPAKLTETADGKELAIDMADTQPIKPPRGAPGRFFNVNRLELSEFSSWGDVSALMAPLYAKAATLAPDSQVKAEAAKIAASFPDSKGRAAAALRLVQDKVRYLFLGMDRGGYIPADADRTWTRRFGDCKGKTVLLLALLNELGIQAQPAMVSSTDGDGLDSLLPMARAFDHVLIRAVIDGKVYWLDGTRSGDRGLDGIVVPRFRWALPIQASGASLEELKEAPFDKPQTMTQLRLDASKGLDVPAPAHAEQILRGDEAIAMKLGLGGKSPADIDTYLRHMWTEDYDWIDIQKVDFSFDEASGEAKLSMDGTGKMTWKIYRGDAGRQFRVDDSRMGWNPDYSREAGPHGDAPFAVRFPYFVSASETVILPQNGDGFTVAAADVDKQLGGYELKRSAHIEKGIFTMTASTRSAVKELPFAETAKAKVALKDLSEISVYIQAPPTLNKSSSAATKDGGVSATSPVDLMLARAGEAYAKGDFAAAIKSFSDVIAAEPNRAEVLAARGTVYVATGDLTNGAIDIDKASKLDPKNPAAASAQVVLHIAQKDFSTALTLVEQQIKANPNDFRALGMRSQIYLTQGQLEKGGADLEEAIRRDPNEPSFRSARIQLLLLQHKASQALADADKLIALMPDAPNSHDIRAFVLTNIGRHDEAMAEYNAALAIKPDAATYFRRAKARDFDDTAQILADLDSAQKLNPKLGEIYLLRTQIFLRQGNFAEALKSIDEELRIAPNYDVPRRQRVLALAGSGQPDAAITQLDALIAKRPNEADLLMERCRYKAARGQGLEDARADCSQALRLEPQSDDVQMALAFTYLKEGRLDEALKRYDAVIVRRPNSGIAHFERGMIEAATGAAAAARADFVAARHTDAQIDAKMELYGSAPEPFGSRDPEMTRLQAAADVKTNHTTEKPKDETETSSEKKISRKPISIVRPNYPEIAEDYQIEGYVDFEFTVEADGSVGDPIVTTEYPEGVGLADAALKVFPKWKFSPERINDKAVPTRAYYRFSFKLA